MHRDIKPENILIEHINIIDKEITVKLSDFGFATYFNEKDKLTHSLGSSLYMAPELIKGQKYGEKVDVWSACVVTFMMLSGYPPFEGEENKDIYRAIRENDVRFGGQEWHGISEEAKDFILCGLKKNQYERQSSSEMLNHPWLTFENIERNFDQINQTVRTSRTSLSPCIGNNAL